MHVNNSGHMTKMAAMPIQQTDVTSVYENCQNSGACDYLSYSLRMHFCLHFLLFKGKF